MTWTTGTDFTVGSGWTSGTDFVYSSSVTRSPGSGAVSYAGQASSAVVSSYSNPGSASETYAGKTTSLNLAVASGASSEVYTGQASSVGHTHSSSPSAAAETYTGQASTLGSSNNDIVLPGGGAVQYTGKQSSLFRQDYRIPGYGAEVYQGRGSSLATKIPSGNGAIAYAGQAPFAQFNSYVRPTYGAVQYTGKNSVLGFAIRPSAGQIVYTGRTSTLRVAISIGIGSIMFVDAGAFTSSTGALSVAWPSYYSPGDLALLLVESANQAIATPAGWTQAASSPQFTGTAGAAGGVRLAVFWKVTSSSSETAVTVADTGSHTSAQIVAFRGVNPTSPFNATAGAVTTPTNFTITCPSVTTGTNECLIVLCVGNDRDANSSTSLSGWTNANLTGLTEIADNTSNTGAGGGIGIAAGGKRTAGSTGTTTVTNAAKVTAAQITLALQPASPKAGPGVGAQIYTGKNNIELQSQVTFPNYSTELYTGQANTLLQIDNHWITPDSAAKLYSGQASTADTSLNQWISAGYGAVVYTGTTSTEVQTYHQFTSLGSGVQHYAGQANTEVQTYHQWTLPGYGLEFYQGSRAAGVIPDNRISTPVYAQLQYGGQSSPFSWTDHHWVDTGTGSKQYEGQGSVVNTGIIPGAGQQIYTGEAGFLFNEFRTHPDKAAALYSGGTSVLGFSIALSSGAVLYTGTTPTLGNLVEPGSASLVYGGLAPAFDYGVQTTVNLNAGSLHYSGTQPFGMQALRVYTLSGTMHYASTTRIYSRYGAQAITWVIVEQRPNKIYAGQVPATAYREMAIPMVYVEDPSDKITRGA